VNPLLAGFSARSAALSPLNGRPVGGYPAGGDGSSILLGGGIILVGGVILFVAPEVAAGGAVADETIGGGLSAAEVVKEAAQIVSRAQEQPIEPLAPPLAPTASKPCDCAACERWKNILFTRSAPSTGPAFDYQRRVAGSTEYRIDTRFVRISQTWADSIDCTTCSIIDAKYVGYYTAQSPWVNPFVKNGHNARLEAADQLRRYKEVINSPDTPVTNVKYYTNKQAGVPFFASLINTAGLQGRATVEVKP